MSRNQNRRCPRPEVGLWCRRTGRYASDRTDLINVNEFLFLVYCVSWYKSHSAWIDLHPERIRMIFGLYTYFSWGLQNTGRNMYQCLSLRPHKFSVFHKNVHSYMKWRYERLCTEQYLTVWDGRMFNRVQFYDTFVRCRKCNKLTSEEYFWSLDCRNEKISSHFEANIPNIREVFISG